MFKTKHTINDTSENENHKNDVCFDTNGYTDDNRHGSNPYTDPFGQYNQLFTSS